MQNCSHSTAVQLPHHLQSACALAHERVALYAESTVHDALRSGGRPKCPQRCTSQGRSRRQTCPEPGRQSPLSESPPCVRSLLRQSQCRVRRLYGFLVLGCLLVTVHRSECRGESAKRTRKRPSSLAAAPTWTSKGSGSCTEQGCFGEHLAFFFPMWWSVACMRRTSSWLSFACTRTWNMVLARPTSRTIIPSVRSSHNCSHHQARGERGTYIVCLCYSGKAIRKRSVGTEFARETSGISNWEPRQCGDGYWSGADPGPEPRRPVECSGSGSSSGLSLAGVEACLDLPVCCRAEAVARGRLGSARQNLGN